MGLALLCGCGNNSLRQTGTQPPPAITLSAAQVFSPTVGQVWTFQNGYGDTTTIAIQAAPDPAACISGKNIVWHYSKSAARAYWQLGVADAELDFVLHQEADGSWRSVASLISFPHSCPYCVGGWTSGTLDPLPMPGQPLPYLIVPGSATQGHTDSLQTQYAASWDLTQQTLACLPDPGPGSAVPWRTDAYVENVSTPAYTGPAMVSEQWEGPCFPAQAGCNHEKWYFAPNLGLVKVVPLDQGQGQDNVDPKLAIERIP
jgi:hypothetical protein